ncbi:hypothetical protein CSZ94_15385 [Janthinobacterium sp. ROICE36]|uniref:hypothetical protein n=1 Tax=Janthinobacterium sp. ROICE36 TaxID=2048670 RepID=UPI000C7F276D|nr:hypothetical protein [Janthinobacterium sp. ROICE36]PLY41524.1 hypothetical protein CSZ94_15385 [Janthinobacterium sp. ROICE36]
MQQHQGVRIFGQDGQRRFQQRDGSVRVALRNPFLGSQEGGARRGGIIGQRGRGDILVLCGCVGLQKRRQAGKVWLDTPFVMPRLDHDRFERFAADGPVQAESVAVAQRAFGKRCEA